MKRSVYIQIHENRIQFSCFENQQTTEKFGNFSTARLAIGDFEIALQMVKDGVREIYRKPFFIFPPIIIMHQVLFGDKKLSSVELRVLHEIGTMAGGNPVHLWQGHQLSPEEIHTKKYIQ